MRRRVWTAMSAVGAAALLTASCGGDDESTPSSSPSPSSSSSSGGDDVSARELVQRGLEALEGAGSARISIELSGTRVEPRVAELHIDDGDTCSGLLEYRAQGSIDLVGRGEELWLKPGEAMWQNAGGGGEFEEMYIHGTAEHPLLAQFEGICDWETMVSMAAQDEAAGGEGGDVRWVRDGETTTRAGQDALVVNRIENFEDFMTEETYLIASKGEPYLLQYATSAPGDEAEAWVGYADFGEPVNAPSIPDDLTVEVDELGDVNPFEDLAGSQL